jgi:DNA-binding LytR/AlgR family response regulator
MGYFVYFRFNPIFEIAPNDAIKIILISIFAISILVILNQNRLMKLNVNQALTLNQKLSSKLNTGQNSVFFESKYKKDSITLSVNSIRVIKSAGNYIEIYFFENGKISKHFVRSTFVYAEKLLENYNFIFRCHRTYLVNTNFIKEAEGTPQGVKIQVQDLDFLVPVSQNYILKLQDII